jgi:ferritin-like metal-binding protein YciE
MQWVTCIKYNEEANQNKTKQKLLLYLNDALSIENAAAQRLATRIGEVTLQDVRNQLEYYRQETKEHQNRLGQLIFTLWSESNRSRKP